MRKMLLVVLMLAVCFGQTMYKAGDDARLAPRLLNYQGYLIDTLGNPITNPSLALSFAIFDSPSGGLQKWSETQGSVSVDKGIFNVLLGSATAIPDSVFANSANRYLQLTVAGQVLSPRTRIVSAAYAYAATYSDTATYARSAAADNDWTRGTPDSILYTVNRVGISRGGSNNMAYGTERYTHINFGVNCTTGLSGQNNPYATVSGGYGNTSSGQRATVGGGSRNTAGGTNAAVLGGINNLSMGDCAFVGGGLADTASADYSTIGGGYHNTASGPYAVLGGGYHNEASGEYAFVGGGNNAKAAAVYGGGLSGYNNRAGQVSTDTAAVVAGGHTNSAYAPKSFIGGGFNNIADGYGSVICGGGFNRGNSDYSTVAGGYDNACNYYAAIGGGLSNSGSGAFSMIAGGQDNSCTDSFSSIGGGYQNAVYSKYSIIIGGYADTIAGPAHYSCLIGVNGNLNTDSTFKVDMPHIYFGSDAEGYEFPNNDGTAGQFLTTNGANHLMWVTPTSRDYWSLRVTDGWDTTLQMDGRWGLARAGNMLYGNADSTHVNFGSACTTGASGPNYKYCTVSGGYSNLANSMTSTIGGGYDNTASGFYSFVGAGRANLASGYGAVVCGGYGDTAVAVYGGVGFGTDNIAGDAVSDTGAAVNGGRRNKAIGKYSYTGGGYRNSASGDFSAVCGGDTNTANYYYATVGGGLNNAASNRYAFVGGGYMCTAGGENTVVGGGNVNSASGEAATVGGGAGNTAGGLCATVSGGGNNLAGFEGSTIAGGNSNIADSIYATVSGGYTNSAGGYAAVLAGGYANAASAQYSTVGGGIGDTASGDYSTVGGGQHNVAGDYWTSVGGGYLNCAGNNYATVPGGRADTASGLYSFATNNNSTATYSNSAAFNGQSATASGQTRVGVLSKASGTFTIDHPLDPEHKILNHYFVESPEMVNVYRGTVVLDAKGRAVVSLPDYFSALNETPMIQLTGVKSNDVWVEEEVAQNTFVIAGKPGIKVFWTVTGARKDPSAEITKIIMPVEQSKEGGLANRSLDDEFLVTTMAQLERMGKAGGFKFRHASEQNRYEEMKRMIEEDGK